MSKFDCFLLLVYSNGEGEDRKRMATEQMNISKPPRMARFIRSKVKAGEYTNVSEAIRDAIRHMQEAEAAKELSRDSGRRLTARERQEIRQRVQQGIKDLEEGSYEEFDERGLREYFSGVVERGKKRFPAADAKRPS